MNNAFLLTGGNLGHREQNLSKASMLVEQKVGKILGASGIYETAPWGIETQPAFLNQVIQVQTTRTVHQLLAVVLQIENLLGRERTIKYGPRQIDIDILFFNDIVLTEADLTVPHPEMQNRRFVLVPLNEIAPDYIHPGLKLSVATLLANCGDPLPVTPYVSDL